MRFALLGHDEFTVELLDALFHQGHDLVAVADAEPHRALVQRWFPRAEWLADWTDALEARDVDATLVARGGEEEQRADRLRRLAQLGANALVSHPAHSSVLVYFELEMICAETRAKLVPLTPWRWRPGVEDVQGWIADSETSPIGPCEQLLLERASTLRDGPAVTAAFARDVDLALLLVGDLNSLSAMAPAWEQGSLANLGVQMTGPAGISVRWAITPPETSVGLKVTLIGQQGKATLVLPDDRAAEALVVYIAGETRSEALEESHAVRDAVEAFVESIDGGEAAPRWSSAARGMELADSIELSLRKGKTIPLYNTVPSEQGTFKGVMAAAGCFLILASLGLVLLGLLLARFGVRHAEKIPLAVAGLLIAFLLLQSLRFVFPRAS